MLGALIGGSLLALGGIGKAALGHYFDKSSAAQSNAYNFYNYQHRYQWQVEDMRKAGLNPILAATQGAGAVPATQVGTSGASAGLSSGAASATAVGRDILNQARQKAGAEVELLREQANTERTKQGAIAAEADVNSAESVIRKANAERAKELAAIRVAAERANAIGRLSDNDTKAILNWVKASEAKALYGFDPKSIGYDLFDPNSPIGVFSSRDAGKQLEHDFKDKRFWKPDSPTVHWFMRHYNVDAKTAVSLIDSLGGMIPSIGKLKQGATRLRQDNVRLRQNKQKIDLDRRKQDLREWKEFERNKARRGS